MLKDKKNDNIIKEEEKKDIKNDHEEHKR